MEIFDKSKKINNEDIYDVSGGYMDWGEIRYVGDSGAYQVVITCPNCGCETVVATLNRNNTCSVPGTFECPQCHRFKKSYTIKCTNPSEGPYIIWNIG